MSAVCDEIERVDRAARRDRWLIPLIAAAGFLAGAALFGGGMLAASAIPARCPVPATPTSSPAP